jgi:UDP:flavonoid glycosyltransferase YjiC (YdhE family)
VQLHSGRRRWCPAELTEPRLWAAIDRVLGDRSYAEHAAQLARRLQAHDALAAARARIEDMLEVDAF